MPPLSLSPSMNLSPAAPRAVLFHLSTTLAILDIVIEIMIEALLENFIGSNTDLIGSCLNWAVEEVISTAVEAALTAPMDACLSRAKQGFNVFYKDINAECESRFKTKWGKEEVAYFNPVRPRLYRERLKRGRGKKKLKNTQVRLSLRGPEAH